MNQRQGGRNDIKHKTFKMQSRSRRKNKSLKTIGRQTKTKWRGRDQTELWESSSSVVFSDHVDGMGSLEKCFRSQRDKKNIIVVVVPLKRENNAFFLLFLLALSLSLSHTQT